MLVFLGIASSTSAQTTTIYNENFDGPITGYSTTTQGNSGWYISAAFPSTSPFSGKKNLANPKSNNREYVYFDNNLSTVGYTNITILWAAWRDYPSVSRFEWSSNGSTWNNITFTEVANTSTWDLTNNGTRIILPAGAEGVANLQFRWSYNNSNTADGDFRIDDISVQGCKTPIQPSVISGSTSTCVGSSYTYNVVNTNGVIYNWTFPPGWTQTAGGNSNSVTVTAGSTSGTIQVIPSTNCSSATGPARAIATSTTSGLWTGNISRDWDNPSNWCSGMVPASSTDVNIPTTALNQPILNSSVICNNITLNGSATLSIASSTLTIGGDLLGTGSLVGSATAGLTISGAGPAISLRFMQTLLPADRTLFNYTQTRGATVTLTTPLEIINKVDITGVSAFLQSAGYLTLISTLSGGIYTNANVANLTSSTASLKVIQGNVNVQSVFTGENLSINRGYRSVSSPIDDNSSPLPPKNTYSQLKDYMLVTGTNGVVNGFDAGGTKKPYATTIKTYNEGLPYTGSKFVPITNITDKVKPGIGFFVYFRGDRLTAVTNKLNGTNNIYPPSETVTAVYTGQLNQGPYSINVTNSNQAGDTFKGYNLVGNPYPSVIDWRTVLGISTNLQNVFYVYTPNGGLNTWASGEAVPKGDGASPYIQPGQGFYVVSGVGGGTLRFTEACKSAPVSSQIMRFLSAPQEKLQMSTKAGTTETKVSSASAVQKLRITLQDNINTEETLVVFENGNLSVKDEKDALSFGGSSMLLSSYSSDNQAMTINFMSELKEIKEVKLYMTAYVNGPLKMNFTELPSSNYQVFLRDEFLDKTIDVRTNPSYTFDIDLTRPSSVGADRFKMLFLALPTKLGTVTARRVKNAAELNWSTLNEMDNDHFEIEKSRDGKVFEKIGQVKGAGTSSVSLAYSFTDKDPATGINYYRLKQVSLDGKISISDTVSVEFEKLSNPKNSVVVLYPNPAHNQISIRFKESFIAEVTVRVSDTRGRVVKTQTIKADVNPVSLDISSLSPGMYIIEFVDSKTNKVISRNKFIKE